MQFIPQVASIATSALSGNLKPLLFGSMVGGGSSAPKTDPTQADPFAPYRQGYAQQLNSFWNNPNAVTQDPAFQAQLQAGIGAVNSGLAASGQLASGSQLTALNNLGMQTMNQYRQQQLANLMQLSGASQNPAAGASAAASIASNNYNNQRQGQADLLGGLGTLSGLFRSGGSGSFMGNGGGGSSYDYQGDPDFLKSVGL